MHRRRPEPAPVSRTLQGALACLLLSAVGSAQALPYAGFRVQVDGVLDEWRAPLLERQWQELQAPPPSATRCVRVWPGPWMNC